MPIYDYRCTGCNRVIELLVRNPDQEPSACPECGQGLRKMPSAGHTHRASSTPGHTCCGREERCDKPPCSSGESCRRA